MVQRHTISHLKALIVDKNIPGGQGRGSIMLVFVLFLVLSKIDEIRNQYLRCTIASACICIFKPLPFRMSAFSIQMRVDAMVHLKY